MKIKLFVAVFFALFFFNGASNSMANERPWIMSFYFNQGDWSASGVDHDGSQSIAFTQIAYKKKKWGLAFTESYVSSSYKTSQSDERFEVDSPTDVALSSYYIKRFKKFSIRSGLDISLPTGKNQFTKKELQRIIIDDINEDLMLLNNYGAGFNIKPHVVAVYEKDKMTWGLGASYLISGPYDPLSDDDSSDKYDQGDKLSILLSSMRRFSNSNFAFLTASYSHWGKDTFGGRELFRNGDLYKFEGRWVKEWVPGLRGTVGAIYSRQDKNEALTGEDAVVSERSNTNGNKFELFVNGVYKLNKTFSPTFIVGYKQVAGNGYEEGEPLHDAGRSMVYAEPGVIWYFKKGMYATGKLRYSKIEDSKDYFSEADATYNVLNLDIGIVYGF